MDSKQVIDSRPASVSGIYFWKKIFENGKIHRELFSAKSGVQDYQEMFKEYVAVVNIETFNFCNRKCNYCPVSFLSQRHGKIQHMSDGIYHQIISDLQLIDYSEKLSFNLYNEPLASKKNLYSKLEYARTYLPNARLIFNSNGDYLDIEALDNLAKIGVTSINITLQTKGEYIHLDKQKELKAFYSKLKKNLEITSDVSDKHIKSHFYHNRLRVDVSCINYDEFGHSRSGAIEYLKVKEKRNYPCARPFRELTIFHDGFVYPCCNIMSDLDPDKKMAIGHISQCESIYSLFASKMLQSFRRDLFSFGIKKSPCDDCSERFCTTNDNDRGIRDEILESIEGDNKLIKFTPFIS